MIPLAPLPLLLGPLGMQEMLIIMGVALIVFGPRKLPTIGKTLGKTVREFRSQSQQLRNTLEREVQMEEFREARQEVVGLGRDLGKGLDPNAPSPPSRGPTRPEAATSAGPARPEAPPSEAEDGPDETDPSGGGSDRHTPASPEATPPDEAPSA